MTRRLPPLQVPGDLVGLLPDAVWGRLVGQYDGVFDQAQLRRHVLNSVDLDAAKPRAAILRRHAPTARRVLDVGAGYGSFTTAAALETGGVVVGVDLEMIELRFAASRDRGTAATAYAQADGAALPFATGSFDAVTMWHVMEHVPDPTAMLAEVRRVVVAGGPILLLCPNYAAFRFEPHYLVPWVPFLRGQWADRWLRLLGRDPSFFASEVFPWTAFEVRRALDVNELLVEELASDRLRHLDEIRNPLIRKLLRLARRIVGGHLEAIVDRLSRSTMAPTVRVKAVAHDRPRRP